MVRLVIDCIVRNKCWKLIRFSFSIQFKRVLFVQVFFNRSPNWNFFHLNFCSILHTHFSEFIVLPVTYFWKKTSFFDGLGYIVFIHKRFCCAQLQVFSHIWEQYFSYSKKLVDPNFWPSVYYGFSLLHKLSLVLQPWMTAYIRKTDGVYISVPQKR